MGQKMSRERFLESDIVKQFKMDSMSKAEKAWAAINPGYRRFIAKQAGLNPDLAEGRLGDIPLEDQEKLYSANKAIEQLSKAARDPLVKACINKPRPRGQGFKL
jgi:hypothetical protein